MVLGFHVHQLMCVTTVTMPVHLHWTNFAPFLLLTRRCYNAETSAFLLINLAHAGARLQYSCIVCVCVCVSVTTIAGASYAYSTGPTKVPKESARHKDKNICRN